MKPLSHGALWIDPLRESYLPSAESDFLSLAGLGGGEPSAGPQIGVKALMQAVLEDGVRNYLGRNARLRAEAEHWVASPRHTSPFAFRVVCETLGFEPSAVRVALRRLRDQHQPNAERFKRMRPNVRRTARPLARTAG